MTWRDELIPASLDGVPLKIDATNLEFGPRTVLQKFPQTASVRVQELGDEADVFSIEAYAIGPEYIGNRDAIMARIRAGGTHTLDVPTFGTYQVGIIGRPRVSESRTKGAFARISFRAVALDPRAAAQSTVSARDAAVTAATAAREQATASLGASLSGLDRETPLAAFQAAVGDAQVALATASARVIGSANIVTSATQTVTALGDSVEAALASPSVAIERINEAVGAVIDAALDVDETQAGFGAAFVDGLRLANSLAALRYLRGTDTPLVRLTRRALASDAASGSGDVALGQRNAFAVAVAVRHDALLRVIEAALEVSPESRQQAEAVRAELYAAAYGNGVGDDNALMWAMPDVMKATARQALTRAAQYLTSASIDLPELRTHTTRGDAPALLLAHQLLGDASRWPELVARNSLPHPIRVSSGTAVEYVAA